MNRHPYFAMKSKRTFRAYLENLLELSHEMNRLSHFAAKSKSTFQSYCKILREFSPKMNLREFSRHPDFATKSTFRAYLKKLPDFSHETNWHSDFATKSTFRRYFKICTNSKFAFRLVYPKIGIHESWGVLLLVRFMGAPEFRSRRNIFEFFVV